MSIKANRRKFSAEFKSKVALEALQERIGFQYLACHLLQQNKKHHSYYEKKP